MRLRLSSLDPVYAIALQAGRRNCGLFFRHEVSPKRESNTIGWWLYSFLNGKSHPREEPVHVQGDPFVQKSHRSEGARREGSISKLDGSLARYKQSNLGMRDHEFGVQGFCLWEAIIAATIEDRRCRKEKFEIWGAVIVLVG